MGFKSDIEIAQECEMLPITKIAEKAGIDDKYLEQYGKYKAKIDYNLLKESDKKDGKLILVTAINPTPAGEGKTTIMRIILGLINPQSGKSVMRDNLGNECALSAATREMFSYVPQGNTIFAEIKETVILLSALPKMRYVCPA